MSNIEVAFHRCTSPSPARARCSRMLRAFCVSERLPELSATMIRSPSRAKTRILEKRAIWSTPALVRESDAKIIPASSDMATQYVIKQPGLRDGGILPDRVRALVGRHEEVPVDLGTDLGDSIEELHKVLVQAELDDVVGLPVTQPGMQLSGCPLELPRVLVAQRLQGLVNEGHARVQRARHILAQDQQLRDAPWRDHVA